MVYCKLQINEIHNLKQFQKISVISPRTEYDMKSSHTDFPIFSPPINQQNLFGGGHQFDEFACCPMFLCLKIPKKGSAQII